VAKPGFSFFVHFMLEYILLLVHVCFVVFVSVFQY